MIKRLYTRRVYKKIEFKELKQMVDPFREFINYVKSTFHYGVIRGSVYQIKRDYRIDYEPHKFYVSVRIPEKVKAVDVKFFAHMYMKKYNFENNLVYNKYRFNEDNNGVFIEAYADDKLFYCDISDILHFYSGIWHYRKFDNRVYCQKRNKGKLTTIMFHHLLYKKSIRLKFKDGNSLNLRKHNIIVLKPKTQKSSDNLKT